MKYLAHPWGYPPRPSVTVPVSLIRLYLSVTSALPARPTYIQNDLITRAHVFVRCGSVKPPLHPDTRAHSALFPVTKNTLPLMEPVTQTL